MSIHTAALSGEHPICVIGAGYSGTVAAIQLARITPPNGSILLCERNSTFGAGRAYATNVPSHVLNVRAANMSAFASEPSHFEDWTKALGNAVAAELYQTDAGIFASRGVYGKYLESILGDALDRSRGARKLHLLHKEIVDCRPTDDGFELLCNSGRKHLASAVVLASGHVPPCFSDDARYVTNPWAEDALHGLDETTPVLVLGTGLTMVDIVMSLRRNGFAGTVFALSRRGLLPQPHRASGQWPTPHFSDVERRSVRRATRRLRLEVETARKQNVDWRAVIDSIRPITADIWRSWTLEEQRRFLRHARRWWDIHRHRMAPPNETAIQSEIADGRLRIVAGHIGTIGLDKDVVRVAYRPAGGNDVEILSVQRVIVATGLERAENTPDPLIQRLLQRGLVRLDGHGIGIDVTDDLQAIGRGGSCTPNLWALGPLVRGVFWECVAVPDIRHQAERLAYQVALTPDHEPFRGAPDAGWRPGSVS
jgi:uncharacterized NAD(P)/FAD-binding protein YdhS